MTVLPRKSQFNLHIRSDHIVSLAQMTRPFTHHEHTLKFDACAWPAEKTWPGKGYKETAKGICKALLTHCIKAGESHMPMTGDDAGLNDYNRLISRSSDWMPAHFKLFEQARKK